MRRMVRPQGVLGERDFRLFFFGYLVSLTGSAMVPVALTFAILGQGGSAGDVGLVLASETAALVGLLLAGGVVADRLSRKSLMVGADLARCAAQVALAALLLSGRPSLATMMTLAAVLGAGQAVFGPALSGLVPAIASPTRLQQANALIGVARSVGQIAGPALAGLLVAAGGAPWAILADAASYAAGAACLVALRPLPAGRSGAAESFLTQLRLGWTEFRSRTWLWVIVGQFAFHHMLVFAPFMVLGAIVAERALGGAASWGLILSAQGGGAVIGGLGVLRLHPRRPLLWATLAMSGTVPLLVLLAWPAPLPALVAAAVVSGAGIAVFTALFDTTFQREVPPEALSRVSSYDWLGSFALFPLGYALAGPAGTVLGASGTLLFSAGWLTISTGLVALVPAVRSLRAEA